MTIAQEAMCLCCFAPAAGLTSLIFNCASLLFVLHLEKSKLKPPHGGGLVGLFSCTFALSYYLLKTFCPRGDNFVNATKCCYIFVAIADSLRGKKTKSKRIICNLLSSKTCTAKTAGALSGRR